MVDGFLSATIRVAVPELLSTSGNFILTKAFYDDDDVAPFLEA